MDLPYWDAIDRSLKWYANMKVSIDGPPNHIVDVKPVCKINPQSLTKYGCFRCKYIFISPNEVMDEKGEIKNVNAVLNEQYTWTECYLLDNHYKFDKTAILLSGGYGAGKVDLKAFNKLIIRHLTQIAQKSHTVNMWAARDNIYPPILQAFFSVDPQLINNFLYIAYNIKRIGRRILPYLIGDLIFDDFNNIDFMGAGNRTFIEKWMGLMLTFIDKIIINYPNIRIYDVYLQKAIFLSSGNYPVKSFDPESFNECFVDCIEKYNIFKYLRYESICDRNNRYLILDIFKICMFIMQTYIMCKKGLVCGGYESMNELIDEYCQKIITSTFIISTYILDSSKHYLFTLNYLLMIRNYIGIEHYDFIKDNILSRTPKPNTLEGQNLIYIQFTMKKFHRDCELIDLTIV
jgi:hypothetical protein